MPQPRRAALRTTRWLPREASTVTDSALDEPTGDATMELSAPNRRASIDDRMRERCRRHAPILEEAARAAEVDPALLLALAWIESGFNPGAVSRAGAVGILQMMRSTAATFGCSDPEDVACAAAAAAAYVARLLRQFEGEIVYALCAYNAGPVQPRRAFREGILPANYGFAAKVIEARARMENAGCAAR
ncbi:MAG: hypothetical protein EXR79_12460 [Myxococcales bacterium]|nr:hypothetical protein [Myxococcales bacterium]